VVFSFAIIISAARVRLKLFALPPPFLAARVQFMYVLDSFAYFFILTAGAPAEKYTKETKMHLNKKKEKRNSAGRVIPAALFLL